MLHQNITSGEFDNEYSTSDVIVELTPLMSQVFKKSETAAQSFITFITIQSSIQLNWKKTSTKWVNEPYECEITGV